MSMVGLHAGRWPTYAAMPWHWEKPKQLKFIQCGVCDIVAYTEIYFHRFTNGHTMFISFFPLLFFSCPSSTIYMQRCTKHNTRCSARCSRRFFSHFIFFSSVFCISRSTFLFHFNYFVYRKKKVIAPHSFNRIESAYSRCVCECVCPVPSAWLSMKRRKK